MSPIKDVAGAFKNHSKPKDMPFDEIRQIAWENEMAWKMLQNRMLKGYDFKNTKFTRDEIYDRYENSIHFKNNPGSK